jgi:hypothetical protein
VFPLVLYFSGPLDWDAGTRLADLWRRIDEQSGYSFCPFPCYPGTLARSWRRPFHRCGVPYPQAPTLDRGSLTATIAEFMHVGPHPRRLNGTLGTSHSSAPFRNRSEAFDTAWRSQSLEQAKVPRAVLSESPNRSPWRSTSKSTRTWFEGFSAITTRRDSPPVVLPG